jgi:hypothetical protein
MPIRLVENSSSTKLISILENVHFLEIEGDNYFQLTDTTKKNEIRIKFIPEFVSIRDPERFECILFENAYLTAENDIFELYESTISGRFGWIFPISALDSNDNDFVGNDSFKHYRHIAYQKLLERDYEIKYQESKVEFQLSEIFRNIFVCILSKDEIAKLPGFQIEHYTLSFLKYDYLLYNGSLQGKIAFDKTKDIGDIRKGKHSFKIHKSSFDITLNAYTKSLFLEHLYQTENPLIKYILLYQILEHFIQEKGDSLLDPIILEYQQKKITKNTLREKIGKIQSDRNLLKKVIDTSIIKKETKDGFNEKCTYLFNDLKLDLDNNFGDIIYDLRNLITHNYRILTDKTNELNEVILLFEAIMFELLITLNEKKGKDIEEETEQPSVKANIGATHDFFDKARILFNKINKSFFLKSNIYL